MVQWWRRGDSNPRPGKGPHGIYARVPCLGSRFGEGPRTGTLRNQRPREISRFEPVARSNRQPAVVAPIRLAGGSGGTLRLVRPQEPDFRRRLFSVSGCFTRPTGDLGAPPWFPQSRRNRCAPNLVKNPRFNVILAHVPIPVQPQHLRSGRWRPIKNRCPTGALARKACFAGVRTRGKPSAQDWIGQIRNARPISA